MLTTIGFPASRARCTASQIVSEAIAEPKLRVAIDAAASGDDVAIEEALREGTGVNE